MTSSLMCSPILRWFELIIFYRLGGVTPPDLPLLSDVVRSGTTIFFIDIDIYIYIQSRIYLVANVAVATGLTFTGASKFLMSKNIMLFEIVIETIKTIAVRGLAFRRN